jgi:hypothetical protein
MDYAGAELERARFTIARQPNPRSTNSQCASRFGG